MFLHEVFNQAGGLFSSQSKIQAGIRPQNASMHNHAMRSYEASVGDVHGYHDHRLYLDSLFSSIITS